MKSLKQQRYSYTKKVKQKYFLLSRVTIDEENIKLELCLIESMM